ncbi:MAG: helix-turn-helix domain-containing protein [Betaproteobacteria bacterium]|nr:helix-turn-helix domain-containing protein [Betaproteobacteria bacterium]
MSIAAMNWVWQLRLKPSIKFVLLALADAADDTGYCWPSIPTLAKKTSLDDRSVQRILHKLKADDLVQVQNRFRNDGSATSNGYRLSLENGGDKLPPPNPVACHEVVAHMTPAGGSRVTQTTTEHTKQSKPPQPSAELAGEGGGSPLICPKQFSPKEIAVATRNLEVLSPELAQELLDELAGRLNANSVRGAPLSYLRSLIARAVAGTFEPEVGVRIAHTRQRDKELAAIKPSASPPKSELSSIDPREQIEKLRKVLSPNKTNFKRQGNHGYFE